MLLSVLGINPRLSLAEIISVYGGADLHSPVTATFEGEPYYHLGGSIKLGEVIADLPTRDWADITQYLIANKQDIFKDFSSKFSLGLSVYGQKISDYQPACLDLKRELAATGPKPRVVMGKGQDLSSAQVLHNRLVGNGIELIISIGQNGTKIAKTIWVQDIDAYSKRDFSRPCRDMKVGMLPPKLAQIMLNLAPGTEVYDPFCGSGVVLQEALLMGRAGVGSDISEKMVACSETNLKWLEDHFKITEPWKVFLADAQTAKVPDGVDTIVTEGYLGPRLFNQLDEAKLRGLASEAKVLLEASLANLAPQLVKGARLCIAAPAWRHHQNIITPPLFDSGGDLGYNLIRLSGISTTDLLYLRSDQLVGRQLILLEKSSV